MSGIIGVSPDMRSGVVGKYPIGHIIQVKSGTNTQSGNNHANNAWSDSLISVDFTPLFASSKLYVDLSIGKINTWNTDFLKGRFTKAGSSWSGNEVMFCELSISGDIYQSVGCFESFSSYSGTAEISFEHYGESNEAILHTGSYNTIRVTEVSQ